MIEYYDVILEFIPLNFTKSTVKLISGMSIIKAASPDRIGAAGLQQWLLCFGIASQRLCHTVASLAQWMVNDFPSWATIRTLTANRLMDLDKYPGVQPIGIGEILRWLLTKYVLKVDGANSAPASRLGLRV